MRRGRRYSNDTRKLNYKKVVATILAILVVILFIYIIKNFVLGNTKERLQAESYFPVYEDNKWGVVGSSGKKVIEPSYTEYIVIPNEKKDVFICTYDVDYTAKTYKTKVLNSKNEEIFTTYEQVEALSTVDSKGNLKYEGQLLRAKKDGKYGLVGFDGKVILDFTYDNISVLDGVTGAIVLEKDGNKGLANSEGKVVIEPEYTNILPLGKEFKEGFITVDNNLKYGLVDYTNKKILENKYQEISTVYGNDMYYVKEDGTWKVIKSDSSDVLSLEDKNVKQITSSEIVVEKDNLFGTVNLDGTEKIKMEYQYLEIASADTYIVKKNDLYGIVDSQGDLKVNFEYTSLEYEKTAGFYIGEDKDYKSSIIDSNFKVVLIGYLSELNLEKGYMKIRVDNEYKYYNFKFEEKKNSEILANNSLFLSKKDDKYGFVNAKGEVIIDYVYDDATEQNVFGYAAINKDGKWGAIDADGNIVADIQYDLSDNLAIDFIGEWHLGRDLNMNYYTK